MLTDEQKDLVEQHLEHVSFLVKRTYNNRSYTDDLIQECNIALIRCAESWVPTKNIPFWGYARIRVEGKICDYFRALNGRTNKKNNVEYLGESDLEVLNGAHEYATPYFDSHLCTTLDIKKSLDKLNNKQKDLILKIFYQDKKGKDLAEELGISAPRVSQLLSQIFKKLRKELPEYA